MGDLLGADLMVLPNLVAYDAAQVDLTQRTPSVRGLENLLDLGVITGRDNLAQALILRLLTPLGSLASLGHAEYGSQLHKLIGRRKSEALRNLCRAYVLEVVAQEPRVEDTAVSLDFDVPSETSSSFVFTLVVQPRSGDAPVGLSLGVAI